MEDYAKKYKEYMQKKKDSKSSKKDTIKTERTVTPGEQVIKLDMGSPEQVVDSPFERISLDMEPRDEDEPPRFKTKEQKPKINNNIIRDGECINIHLSIKPRYLERAIFVSIILILIIILFIGKAANNPSGEAIKKEAEISGMAVDDVKEETKKEEVVIAPVVPETQEVKEENVGPPEVKEEEPVEEPVIEEKKVPLNRDILPDDIVLTIDKAYFNKTDVENYKGTIYKVDMTVANSGPEFKPLIKIYVYDDEDIKANPNYLDTTTPRGEISYDIGILEGQVKKLTTRDINKKTIMYDNNKVYVAIRVFNKDNDMLLAEQKEILTIST